MHGDSSQHVGTTPLPLSTDVYVFCMHVGKQVSIDTPASTRSPVQLRAAPDYQKVGSWISTSYRCASMNSIGSIESTRSSCLTHVERSMNPSAASLTCRGPYPSPGGQLPSRCGAGTNGYYVSSSDLTVGNGTSCHQFHPTSHRSIREAIAKPGPGVLLFCFTGPLRA